MFISPRQTEKVGKLFYNIPSCVPCSRGGKLANPSGTNGEYKENIHIRICTIFDCVNSSSADAYLFMWIICCHKLVGRSKFCDEVKGTSLSNSFFGNNSKSYLLRDYIKVRLRSTDVVTS